MMAQELTKTIFSSIIFFAALTFLCGCAPRENAFMVKEESFKSGGLTIVGHLYIPSGKKPASAIILSHGTNPQGHNRLMYREMCKKFAQRGYLVFGFDYRGYGDFQDPRRIQTAKDLDFIEDLANAISFLQEKYGKNISEITLVGHSFGGGVSIGTTVKDKRVKRVVAIGPPRRIKERFLMPGAAEGKEWLQERFTKDMRLKEPIPLDLIEEMMRPILIDTYVDHYFDKPILLLDGSLESKEDRDFLKNMAEKMKGNITYITLAGADHYFGATDLANVENPKTLEKLISVIDAWIKKS